MVKATVASRLHTMAFSLHIIHGTLPLTMCRERRKMGKPRLGDPINRISTGQELSYPAASDIHALGAGDHDAG
jgi:hypothetical protein